MILLEPKTESSSQQPGVNAAFVNREKAKATAKPTKPLDMSTEIEMEMQICGVRDWVQLFGIAPGVT